MGSYIEEFQDERERKSKIVVTVDGPSGAGKGTLAEHIADKLNLPAYSAGYFFRKIADERDLTVEELSKKADKKVDIEVDRRTLKKGIEESSVIEGRLPSWVMGDYSDLKIYLTADLDDRAERVFSDLESRKTEEGGRNVEEVRDKLRKRDKDNKLRYRNYYDVDTSNLNIYDMIIDNTELSKEEQNKQVDKLLKQRFPDRYEE